MTPTEIILTNRIATGTAFAVLSDDMTQSVFVPAKIIAGLELSPGDRISAIIVPNSREPNKTPWMAVSVKAVAPPQDDIEEMIRQDLSRGAGTAQQIARSICQPVDLVAARLRSMDVVHDTIYALSILDLIDSDDA